MSLEFFDPEIKKLSVKERLDLIERIWDTLPEEMQSDEIPDWHLPILEERLAELEAAQNQSQPWRDVLARFESKS